MKTRSEKIIDVATIAGIMILAAIAVKQCRFPRQSVDAPAYLKEDKGYTFYPDNWHAPAKGLPGDEFKPN